MTIHRCLDMRPTASDVADAEIVNGEIDLRSGVVVESIDRNVTACVTRDLAHVEDADSLQRKAREVCL